MKRTSAVKKVLEVGEGPYTVFAPTDKAFKAIANADMTDDQVTDLLKYRGRAVELFIFKTPVRGVSPQVPRPPRGAADQELQGGHGPPDAV